MSFQEIDHEVIKQPRLFEMGGVSASRQHLALTSWDSLLQNRR
jgi:hypothetical protein